MVQPLAVDRLIASERLLVLTFDFKSAFTRDCKDAADASIQYVSCQGGTFYPLFYICVTSTSSLQTCCKAEHEVLASSIAADIQCHAYSCSPAWHRRYVYIQHRKFYAHKAITNDLLNVSIKKHDTCTC
jgi:hypothetical protein